LIIYDILFIVQYQVSTTVINFVAVFALLYSCSRCCVFFILPYFRWIKIYISGVFLGGGNVRRCDWPWEQGGRKRDQCWSHTTTCYQPYHLSQTDLGPIVQAPLVRFVVDLLWTCCGLVVQLVFRTGLLTNISMILATHDDLFNVSAAWCIVM